MTSRHSGAESWESAEPFVSTNQLIINTPLYIFSTSALHPDTIRGYLGVLIEAFPELQKVNFDFSIPKFPELLKGIRKVLSTLLENFEQF